MGGNWKEKKIKKNMDKREVIKRNILERLTLQTWIDRWIK